ncbi:hypothetical protein [Polycladidibacter hongkongensis]|uniref:hypothetical protein n=1 Tax=Polycladidibacter hongkongensis TaxID=1647556 RepID=UPI00082BB43B|nr:hypothetical protein [Pseudovibrio hongkongensis]
MINIVKEISLRRTGPYRWQGNMRFEMGEGWVVEHGTSAQEVFAKLMQPELRKPVPASEAKKQSVFD